MRVWSYALTLTSMEKNANALSLTLSPPLVCQTHILVRLKTATERESERGRERKREGGDLSSYHIFFSLHFWPKLLLFIISSSHKDEQTP